jgi:predicted N-acetyltransferase YhbS
MIVTRSAAAWMLSGTLGVHPDAHGRGIGSARLSAVFD